MRPSRHYFLWFLNFTMLGTSVGLAFLVTRDAEMTIKSYQESYLVARAKADMDNWREVLGASAPDRARVASAFINRDSLIDFIEELETVARESEMDLVLGEPVIEPTALKLTLQVKGSFPNLYRLFGRLENLPYQLVFDEVDLAAGPRPVASGPEGARWNGNLSLTLTSFNDDYVQN